MPLKTSFLLKIALIFSLTVSGTACDKRTPLKPFLTGLEPLELPTPGHVMEFTSAPQTTKVKPVAISSESEYLVHIQPRDQQGKLILDGLSIDDFEIKDLQVSETISGKAVEPLLSEIIDLQVEKNEVDQAKPKQIILNYDGSGSMSRTDPQEIRKSASKEFFKLLNKDDRVGIYEFYELYEGTDYNSQYGSSDKLSHKIIRHQSLTSNQNELNLAINKLGNRGGNPFYSSIIKIIEDEGSLEDNAFLVNLTDGDATDPDNRSQAAGAIIEKNLKLFIIGLNSPGTNYKDFKEFARDVNGEFFLANNAGQLTQLFKQLHDFMNGSAKVKMHFKLPENKKCQVRGQLQSKVGQKTTVPFKFST